MKLFKTSNISVVKECQYFLGFELPSSTVKVKSERFLLRYRASEMNSVTSAVISSSFSVALYLNKNLYWLNICCSVLVKFAL